MPHNSGRAHSASMRVRNARTWNWKAAPGYEEVGGHHHVGGLAPKRRQRCAADYLALAIQGDSRDAAGVLAAQGKIETARRIAGFFTADQHARLAVIALEGSSQFGGAVDGIHHQPTLRAVVHGPDNGAILYAPLRPTHSMPSGEARAIEHRAHLLRQARVGCKQEHNGRSRHYKRLRHNSHPFATRKNDVGRNAARTCRHNCNTGIRDNPEFQFAFLTPEVYHQLPLLRSFFCIRSRANEPDALGRAFAGTKKP